MNIVEKIDKYLDKMSAGDIDRENMSDWMDALKDQMEKMDCDMSKLRKHRKKIEKMYGDGKKPKDVAKKLKDM